MFKNEFIVRGDFILKHREDRNFIVIDARGLNLKENELIYDRCIPLDYKEFSFLAIDVGDPYDSVPYSKDVLLEKFSRYGIDKTKTILVYTKTKGNESMGEDGRFKYLLNLCDIPCYILDGGIDEILKLNFFKKNNNILDVSIDFKNEPYLNYKSEILTEELLECYDKKNVKLLDVRYKQEYDGTLVFDDYVGGHIKRAINFPYTKIYDEKGYLLDNNKIEEMISNLGITKKDMIVVYCSSGLRASIIFEIFNMLKYKIRIYHESFARWSNIGEIEV